MTTSNIATVHLITTFKNWSVYILGLVHTAVVGFDGLPKALELTNYSFTFGPQKRTIFVA